MLDLRKTWTGGLVSLVVCAVMGSWVSAASATVVDTGQFDGSELGIPDELCGIAVIRDSDFSGRFRIRAGKGEAQEAFFERLNLRETDTFTNPQNGKSLRFETQSLSNELRATRVEGNVFEFTTIEAGQPFVVRDSAGTVVLRDRGNIRRTVLFDTLGDGLPGGIPLGETVVRVSGPHPGFEQTEDEFCATVQSLIG